MSALKLRAYQKEGLDAVWNYFQNGGSGNPILCWPTGTGKSIVPAIFVKSVLRIWPTQRFMLITHVAELISQNYNVLREIWPDAPVGIYSAGLKQKDIANPIIYAGIQSAIRVGATPFGHRDIVFIDEAHLISGDDASMYQNFLGQLKLINPNLKIIGMTATPYRMGMGMITDNGIFTDIVHDITGLKAFNKLIDEGYLSMLIPKRTKVELDVSDVSVAKGEFVASSLEKAVDKQEITYAGLKELLEHAHNRRSWLLFASGIEHATHIAEILNSFGVDCAAVHSKQKPEFNDRAIKAFKNFEIPAIVNYGKLTTGFNHPWIDLIGMFRPTLSVPLWVQMLGRGTRPAEGKNDCLVLDFARNTPRLGPINDPLVPRKKGEKQGEAPIKICEACGTYNYASARTCCNCGQEFEFKIKIFKNAGSDELVKSDKPVFETFDVMRVTYQRHEKVGSPPSMKVTYNTGLQQFNEWVCLEHAGMAKKIARDWWRKRHRTEPPETTDAALQFISQLRVPKKIRVHVNKKHAEVVGTEW